MLIKRISSLAVTCIATLSLLLVAAVQSNHEADARQHPEFSNQAENGKVQLVELEAEVDVANLELNLIELDAELLEAETTAKRAELEVRRARAHATLIIARREKLVPTIRIHKLLARAVDFDFPDNTPLEDVLEFIQQSTVCDELPGGLPIYLDPWGLVKADRTPQSPVVIKTHGVPLRSTLCMLLRQLDLDYQVKDGLIIISSPAGTADETGEHSVKPPTKSE
jgi:hypothetical protein